MLAWPVVIVWLPLVAATLATMMTTTRPLADSRMLRSVCLRRGWRGGGW